MHSDVENRAAARAVGETPRAAGKADHPSREQLTKLSLRSESVVMRATSIGDNASAGFNSHI
ncbi:hypothetical protein [Streptomyces chartreusis]|uniref:hypothetical protein n=1 Tax=Streptomyces chartreusis TaxID=1969 RepID=UPI00363F6766